MGFYSDSFVSAMGLVASLDPQLFTVVGASLKVSLASTLIAGVAGIPAGFLIATTKFRLKRALMTLLNTLLSLPTVVIALFLYSFIARRGILGDLGLLYSLKAIILGQIFLVLPIVTVFTVTAVNRIDERYKKTALTLGATRTQSAWAVLSEARFGIIAAVIAAFGRVIAEIGISMMLGGNIKGFTRTMTTAMALEYDKGEFVLAIALGIILMTISLGVNVVFNAIQGRDS